MDVSSLENLLIFPACLFLVLYVVNLIYFFRIEGDPNQKKVYTNVIILAFAISWSVLMHGLIVFFQLQDAAIEMTPYSNKSLSIFIAIMYSTIIVQALVVNKWFFYLKKDEYRGKEKMILVFGVAALVVTGAPVTGALMYVFNALGISG